MSDNFTLKPNIALGVVPTHIRFVGGLVPDENGKLPRESDGRICCVAEMDRICQQSPVRPSCTQISFFPGTDEGDVEEMISGLKFLDLAVHLVLMVGGANPMNPADEDAVVSQLVASLKGAIKHEVASVGSTSIEEWMSNEAPRTGADFDAAVAQNVKVHLRAIKESGLLESSIDTWHLEFLRPGEFKTFTNIDRAWSFIKEINKALGRNFFKILVDAAHCGDSGLSMEENQRLIAEVAAADHLGVYHASAPTTRGCLSTDDGWIGATLLAAAKSGKLETVFVELFDHEDDALGALRDLGTGHGVDTRDGRSYTQTTIDALVEVARRLNNLQARGFLN
ncbi:hypothetical protein ACFSSA_14155 [Luteolibacter algae]|uniref:Xylose isomerase-like TIM barrel domain-containing protein n=1 Tax=Luteolibacter algae TaxID=454151 RepID=A0ABW5DCR8_9BACT